MGTDERNTAGQLCGERQDILLILQQDKRLPPRLETEGLVRGAVDIVRVSGGPVIEHACNQLRAQHAPHN